MRDHTSWLSNLGGHRPWPPRSGPKPRDQASRAQEGGHQVRHHVLHQARQPAAQRPPARALHSRHLPCPRHLGPVAAPCAGRPIHEEAAIQSSHARRVRGEGNGAVAPGHRPTTPVRPAGKSLGRMRPCHVPFTIGQPPSGAPTRLECLPGTLASSRAGLSGGMPAQGWTLSMPAQAGEPTVGPVRDVVPSCPLPGRGPTGFPLRPPCHVPVRCKPMSHSGRVCAPRPHAGPLLASRRHGLAGLRPVRQNPLLPACPPFPEAARPRPTTGCAASDPQNGFSGRRLPKRAKRCLPPKRLAPHAVHEAKSCPLLRRRR